MDQLQGTQKPSVNGPPVFVARGLTKVYGTPDAPLYALREIDLEIHQGSSYSCLDHRARASPHCSIFSADLMRRPRGQLGGAIMS